MRKYIIKRLLQSVFLLVLVAFIIYVLMRCLPTSYLEEVARQKSMQPGSKSFEEWMQQLSANDSDDPYFQEQAVLGAMWMRNPDDFWQRFMHYMELRPQKIPRIIQEAAWLFGNMQEREIIFSLPIDKSVKDNYDAFLQTWGKYEGQDARVLRGALYSRFGNTYFFEYYFLKDITYF